MLRDVSIKSRGVCNFLMAVGDAVDKNLVAFFSQQHK